MLFAFLSVTGCDQSATTEATQETAADNDPEPLDLVLGPDIENVELAARIEADDAPIILDVRTEEEYESGHIPGAVNILHTEVGARANALPDDPETEIVVHCQSGRRAEIAQNTLAELGYTNVRHLDGDIAGWKEAGLPLE